MKAMLVKNERLVMTEVEKPAPKAGEILIEVKAIGINRADLLQRKSMPMDYPHKQQVVYLCRHSDNGANAPKQYIVFEVE